MVANVVLGLVVVVAVGLVIAGWVGAGLGGVLLALAFLAMVVMAVLTPTTRAYRLTGREPASRWGVKPPSPSDDEPVE
jgi:hypothetical protein